MNTIKPSYNLTLNPIFYERDIKDKVDFLFELENVNIKERYKEILEYININYSKASMINQENALSYFKTLFLNMVEAIAPSEAKIKGNENLTLKQLILKSLSLDSLHEAIHGKTMIVAISIAISDIDDESALDVVLKGSIKMLLDREFLG